jgi:hypothetical protein
MNSAHWTRCRKALAPRGIRVLALSVDEKDDAHVRRYTDARRTHVLIARDASGAVSKSFGTVGVPEAYLVDSKGVMRWRGPWRSARGSC